MKKKNDKRPASLLFPDAQTGPAFPWRNSDLAESEMNDVMISCRKLMDALQLDTIVSQNMTHNGEKPPSGKKSIRRNN